MSSAAATLTADHGHEAPTNTGIPNKKLAMWAFLASDCMFFGTLISTHLIYRQIDQSDFDPKSVLALNITSISTFVLLVSSWLMFLAVNAVHNGKKWVAVRYLSCVVFFGLIFLGFQVYEFSHFVHEYHLTLSSDLFGSTFYVMTGTHGAHVAIGVFWLSSIVIYTLLGKSDLNNAIDIEVAGLYWHFVDIVWIVIFTAVYLFEYV
ncbi:MAG: heme-copper oxidase subunit III [Opitutales bacterium]